MIPNSDATDVAVMPQPRRPALWQAQPLADSVRSRFTVAVAKGDANKQRKEYFLLTHYYSRTLLLLPEAFAKHNEALAIAAMNNLIVLDKTLGAMHQASPGIIPLSLPLTESLHDHYVDGLILQLIEESALPLKQQVLLDQLLALNLLGEINPRNLEQRLRYLSEQEILKTDKRGYSRTDMPFVGIGSDDGIMRTLLGTSLAKQLRQSGFSGLTDIASRKQETVAILVQHSGMLASTASLFVEVASAFLDEIRDSSRQADMNDVLHSDVPRPYQLHAYAALRGSGYQQAFVEAPTGSGKTLIATLCIQDWPGNLARGHSILVLVPTANYQQQWLRELCYSPTGLSLMPEQVYLGTPQDLLSRKKRPPRLIIVTYAALSHHMTDSSSTGESRLLELLMVTGIQYVVMDEVHKMVNSPDGIPIRALKTLVSCQSTDQLRGIVGLSGTAYAHRKKLRDAGLNLVYRISIHELVASGYIAPFAEFGVPFGFSARELGIRGAHDAYKNLVRRFLALAGDKSLRQHYAAVPIEERHRIARHMLDMYAGRTDIDQAITTKLHKWEHGDAIKLNELKLVCILQIATGLTDSQLFQESQVDPLAKLQDEQKLILDRIELLMPRVGTSLSNDTSTLHDAASTQTLKSSGKRHAADSLL